MRFSTLVGFLPWYDPAGRFSWLKLGVLLALLAPAAAYTASYLTHDLGPRPLTQLIHASGDWAIRFLLTSLAVTPLRGLLDWPRVIILRRLIGVTAALYALAHLLLYIIDQKWNLLTVASEIALRFYLTIGFIALLGLAALAVTSTDAWQKYLRQRWKKLHRLVFPITTLALFHYVLQSKADVTAAMLAIGIFAWLALWRLAPKRLQSRIPLALGLAILAPIATALVEGLWYAAATGVRASRVLAANLDPSAMRPSMGVLIGAGAVLVLMVGRKMQKWGRKRFFC
jgi:sulfoxide reductase heme-binding subunit YedZ